MPKHLAVLNAVAEKAGWGQAGGTRHAPRLGAAHELRQLHGRGRRNLHEQRQAESSPYIVAAIDCGTAVNPAQIERQIAGSFAFGLSMRNAR